MHAQRVSWCCGLLVCSVVVNGCDLFQEDKPEEQEPIVELQMHADTFVSEAAARGIDVSARVDTLVFQFRERLDIQGEDYCGYVPYVRRYPHPERLVYGDSVLFSLAYKCWGEQSTYQREALVFHELGHAVLNRGHKASTLSNGAKASIMHEKPQGLYEAATLNRREYYIDELFNPDTPEPDWAK